MITKTSTYRVFRNERITTNDGTGGQVEKVRMYMRDVTPGAPAYERSLDVDPVDEVLTGSEYTVQETYTPVAP